MWKDEAGALMTSFPQPHAPAGQVFSLDPRGPTWEGLGGDASLDLLASRSRSRNLLWPTCGLSTRNPAPAKAEGDGPAPSSEPHIYGEVT